MTIEQIIMEALKKIEREHKVAITSIYADAHDVSPMNGGKYVFGEISFTGKAVRGNPDKESE